MKRVLIVRNDRLGDTILALPAVSAVKRKFPDAEIDFWASPSVSSLIECVPDVAHVIAGGDRGRPRVVERLRQGGYSIAYCLRPTLSNARALNKARIPIRVGTSRRWFSYLFTDRISVRRRGSNVHETELNLALIHKEPDIDIRKAEFPAIILPEANRVKVDNVLHQTGLSVGEPFVILHPGSGGSASEWPVPFFRRLADKIAAKGTRVYVTGLDSEYDKAKEVAGDSHTNLAGMTELLTLAALIQRTKLFVGNSTGPLHLAAALGVKIVGLYPPKEDCLPARWGAIGQGEWCIAPDRKPCRKCTRGSVSHCRCMEELSVEMVFEIIQTRINTN